jgi:aspartate aminotransferase-like enzyme
MVCVDTVSSMAGAPFETDAWDIDFVASSAQKAFALPPGLGFAVMQERGLERAAESPARGLYFDALAFEKNIAKDQTPNTPALPLLYAAAAQMEAILEEGIEDRWARHAAMAQRTHEWVAARQDDGFEIEVLAPESYRSPTVTCITLPDDMGGRALCAALRQRGFVIAPGYGARKDDMVRIGHMGDHTVAELDVLLGALTTVLHEMRSS